MKFLYFGDLHERQNPPENRKDDFRKTVNAKIEEIRTLGQTYNVKAFLQPGDFLDGPKHDAAFLSEVVKRWGFGEIQEGLLALARGEIAPDEVAKKAERQIPIIGAVGNHELYGNAMKSYPKTSLRFLEEIGFIHIPTKDDPILFTDEEGFTVAITAGSYDTGMDTPETINRYIVEEKLGDFHIHIVHGYLTNHSLGKLIPHTTVDDIAKKTKADLTISGHDHIGFPLTEVDGKLFVNPGAVVRLSNDMKEVQRTPQVLLIDITKEHGIRVETIPLKSAPEGKDVLDRSHLAFQKTMNDKMEKIKSLVQKSQLGTGLSITDIIKAISDSKQIDRKLKDRAVELVSEKMKSIQSQNTKAADYIIEKIVLENFQSHAYSEYELKSGLNVFIGKSSSGKSAVQRALAWVYENEGKNPRRFIKNGENYARVSLFLSNGFVISRVVEKKKNGKNGYEVYNPSDGTTTYYNTKSLPLIQDYLGFNYLQIDEKKSIPLNFQKQGMSWFFIGDGFTDTDRAKVIGAVYQTHFVDAVIKDLEAESKKHQIRMKEQKKEIQKTEEAMRQYDYLADWEQRIQEAEARLEKLRTLEGKAERVKALAEGLKDIERQISENKQIIQSLNILPELEKRWEEAKRKEEKRKAIEERKAELEVLDLRIRKEESVLRSLNQVEQAAKRMSVLDKKVDTYRQMQELWEKASKLERELETLSVALERAKQTANALKRIDEAKAKLEHVHNLLERHRRGVELFRELSETIRKGKEERNYIQKLEEKNRQDVAEYQKLLAEIGTCPLCQSQVTKETIDRIAQSYLMTETKGRIKNERQPQS